ncbi:uncharacterized protein [Lepeophtheirus salmonis]|uniref:uncharacterized protein n=1 Tax=Lepeophtheirus salmonis TaxID=72036 RepID=UPI001AE3EF1D|nr:THAP domain-containing protein 1-like [Lepeophtheirus salmonis]
MGKSSVYSSVPESAESCVSTFTASTVLSGSKSSSVHPPAPTIPFSTQTLFSPSKQWDDSKIEFQQSPEAQQSKKRRHSSATCAITSCPSPSNVSYHYFPKDPTLLRNWVKACRRGYKLNPKTSRICSNHFSQDCYQSDFRFKLLGIVSRKLLKKGSVPSENLYTSSSISSFTIPSERTERSRKNEIHQITQPLLEVENLDSSEMIPQVAEIPPFQASNVSVGDECPTFSEKGETLILKEKIRTLQEELKLSKVETSNLNRINLYFQSKS